MKYILSFILCAFLGIYTANAQTQSVLIKTSAQCSMCKDRLEKSLTKNKGIEKVSLNVDTKELAVSYNNKKTSDTKIRTAVANVGYDADDVKRNAKAHDKLPACCKSEVKAQKTKKGCCSEDKAKKGCAEGL
jgi:periplasmic mercuric ion binding protein